MSTLEFLQREPNHVSLVAGDSVFTKGQTGDNMYAVLEGEIELRLGDRLVETLGAGEIFGEMALIDGSVRSTSATARTDAQLAVIDKKRFLFLIQNTPNFALQVMHIMADRLRRETAKKEAYPVFSSEYEGPTPEHNVKRI